MNRVSSNPISNPMDHTMKLRTLVLFAMALLAVADVFAAEPKPVPQPRPKPQFQYESGDIRISLPTADEPRVKSFGAESIRAAAKYLDDGAVAWMREKSCVACHTPGAYMLDRPLLTKQLGKPNEEVLAVFITGLQDKLPAKKEKDGVTYYALAERAVWRAAGLVQWDKHVTGKTSEHTDRALRSMLLQLSSHGGFYMPDPVEIPHETTDLELSQHAARAIVEAPGWLASLKDPDLLERIERLKTFLRDVQPRHDYDRALRIGIASLLPEVVSPEDRARDIAMLWAKQHADGGWSTRDMSETRNWSAHMTDIVIQLIESQPDAAHPESDPFMTALAICLLRESGTPASDPRIQKAIAWLKHEQRESGRWWMQSLYRGNYQFSTYIATAKALQALALCGEIPKLTSQP
jgi:squalene-hopene/tetraprenyl-beta-curcumene cyclase